MKKSWQRKIVKKVNEGPRPERRETPMINHRGKSAKKKGDEAKKQEQGRYIKYLRTKKKIVEGIERRWKKQIEKKQEKKKNGKSWSESVIDLSS